MFLFYIVEHLLRYLYREAEAQSLMLTSLPPVGNGVGNGNGNGHGSVVEGPQSVIQTPISANVHVHGHGQGHRAGMMDRALNGSV